MSMGPLDLSPVGDPRGRGSQLTAAPVANAIDGETGELTVTDEPADEKTRRLRGRTIAGSPKE